MIVHKIQLKDGERFGKREETAFFNSLFTRGRKINLPDGDEGIMLEAQGSSYWVITKSGAGGKKMFSGGILKELNLPVVDMGKQ